MSRSKRKPYFKERGMRTEDYWRTIRREWKQTIRIPFKFNIEYSDCLYDFDDAYEFLFRIPKEIINDWIFCDYVFYCNKYKDEDHYEDSVFRSRK